MQDKHTEMEFEEKRLKETMAIAEVQLAQTRRSAESKKEEILEAKRDVRENAVHSVGNLWGSDAFEALVELSQCMNPVTEKMADYEEEERRIRRLENLLKWPYFARIDFLFEDEDEAENIYIGRSSLMDSVSKEMYVYDWRSPIASVFYRFMTGKAYYDAPGGRIEGEVKLKRQYEIRNGALEYFFDSNLQINDEFLRQLLSQNTSTKMKAIVETIQREQDVVIRDMENDLLMVQGVAGSGKTSIALHRAAYLMYRELQSKLASDSILIISPNSVFEQYISNVLPELGEESVDSVVFEDILRSLLRTGQIQSKNEFLERMLLYSSGKAAIQMRITYKTSKAFMEVLDRFLEEIPRRWIVFEDIYYRGKKIADRQELRERVLKRPEISLGARLEQLEQYVLELAFGTGKKWKNQYEVDMLRQKVQRFTKLDLIALYRKLFRKAKYFCELAGGTDLEERIRQIWQDTRENLETEHLCYDDAIAIAYLRLKIYGARKYRDIRQVVIDEAQDYYPLQYEIFRLLFPRAKFTILGDINQTLAKQEDLTLYEQIRQILDKKSSSLVTLDKSFRCTNEILHFSLQFMEHSPEIQSFNRGGDSPQVVVTADHEALLERITQEVAACQEKGLKTIGLLCKTERNCVRLFEKLKNRMELQLFQNGKEAELQGVFLMPIYMAKGLEFDAVLLCDADARNYHDKDDKNLLYVGCTRALHRLSLFCEGKKSPWIRML